MAKDLQEFYAKGNFYKKYSFANKEDLKSYFRKLIKENSEINTDSQCWEWKKCVVDGYGQIIPGPNRMIAAHKLSYMIYENEVVGDQLVCHRCDNRKCVNPGHLFLGSHQDNMNDMKNKGRGPNFKGERNPNRKLSDRDIIRIREIGHSQPYTQTAKMFGVRPEMISFIVRNIHWKSV